LIGGDLIIGQGETGAFDFDSTNSAAFEAIATRLTDGVPEEVQQGTFGFNPDSIVIGGAYYGGVLELAGSQIDFIRLVVNAARGRGGFPDVLYVRGEWQIYGTPVPEPSTAGLTAVGLLGLAFRRRSARYSGHPFGRPRSSRA